MRNVISTNTVPVFNNELISKKPWWILNNFEKSRYKKYIFKQSHDILILINMSFLSRMRAVLANVWKLYCLREFLIKHFRIIPNFVNYLILTKALFVPWQLSLYFLEISKFLIKGFSNQGYHCVQQCLLLRNTF